MSDYKIKVSDAELLIKAPNECTAVFGYGGAVYTRKEGTEMYQSYQYQRASDVTDESYFRYSTDNGKNWSPPEQLYKRKVNAESHDGNEDFPTTTVSSGTFVIGHRNPFTGEMIRFSDKREKPAGAHPDLPFNYWNQVALTYAVSNDDAHSMGTYKSLTKQGHEFNEGHPFDGLFLGKNQIYVILEPLFLNADTFLVGVEMSMLGSDGKIYSPTAHDHSQVVVLIARRSSTGFDWDCAPPITLDAYAQSTRGACEPTLGLLNDGRVLLVMRGSNANRPELPCWKWHSVSSDSGRSWSETKAWTYDDKEEFFSPSSICKLYMHSGGRLFWFGNIAPDNEHAYANGKRYPLVIGEVNRMSGLLIRESVTVIEDRKPGMHEKIQFSNFTIYEDRLTRELVLDLPHFYPGRSQEGDFNMGMGYTGDLFRYRITV